MVDRDRDKDGGCDVGGDGGGWLTETMVVNRDGGGWWWTKTDTVIVDGDGGGWWAETETVVMNGDGDCERKRWWMVDRNKYVYFHPSCISILICHN